MKKVIRTWIVPLGAGVAMWSAVIGHMRGNMRVFAIGAALGLGIGLINLIPESVLHWRGKSRSLPEVEPPGWWPYSRALWQGNMRAGTVISLGGVPALGSALLVGSIHEFGWPGSPDELAWYPVLALVTLLLWIIVPGLGISVILFNKPKAIVPPHLRHQRGMWET